MKILVIGGGNMGLTYAKSIGKNLKSSQISILEKDNTKIEELRNTTSFSIYSNYTECVSNSEYILLAVKPQVAELVLEQVAALVHSNQIIISIMAGITIKTIFNILQVPKIVRAMPNLPSQVGYGVTGYYTTPKLAKEDLLAIELILGTTGSISLVKSEDQIDAITALSGSGPAYVLYFMQAMIEQAETFGFTSKEAKSIVLNTFLGTTKLFENSELSASTWMDRVTSKGGTTYAALTSFNKDNIANHIKKGTQAAYNRAKELAKK